MYKDMHSLMGMVPLNTLATWRIVWTLQRFILVRWRQQGENARHAYTNGLYFYRDEDMQTTVNQRRWAIGVALVLAASTQFSVVSFGNERFGSTQIVLRHGDEADFPFFASGEQICTTLEDAPSMCPGFVAMRVRNGSNYLFGLPYMGWVHSLSMLFSAKN